ncbi:MAG: N-acetylglucosamine-6-phosphate deacetylase [Bacteroidia bacterium]|nr:N-acetylglucosamine-6-phosphate deacetylase [Bacteroidia bacterium]
MNSYSLRAIHYRTGNPLEIFMKEGVFSRINNISPAKNLPVIFPGLVDLQVNGWKGTDINREGTDPEDFITLTQDLRQQGITTWFPTLITQSVENLETTLHAYSKVYSLLKTSAPGIHLEGPFISPEEGARGAHPARFVQAPDWALMERWIAISGGNIRLITLSPEWPESENFIRKCISAGVKVSIGHTKADSMQIQSAVNAGASLSTHLGNGSHLVLRRHPNYIWDQLAEDKLYATIITDGFHLPHAVIKSFLRVKGKKALLVSDTTAVGGLPAGEYDAPIGGKVVLTPAGKLHLKTNSDMLAGSAANLRDCVQYLADTGLESLSDAWDRGSVMPSAFIGLPQADGLTPGAPADCVLLHQGEMIGVWKDGVRVDLP